MKQRTLAPDVVLRTLGRKQEDVACGDGQSSHDSGNCSLEPLIYEARFVYLLPRRGPRVTQGSTRASLPGREKLGNANTAYGRRSCIATVPSSGRPRKPGAMTNGIAKSTSGDTPEH